MAFKTVPFNREPLPCGWGCPHQTHGGSFPPTTGHGSDPIPWGAGMAALGPGADSLGKGWRKPSLMGGFGSQVKIEANLWSSVVGATFRVRCCSWACTNKVGFVLQLLGLEKICCFLSYSRIPDTQVKIPPCIHSCQVVHLFNSW